MDRESRQHLNEQLIRLNEGDRRVFQEVFKCLNEPVHRFCRKMLGSDSDGSDAAQNALMKLFSKIHTFDERGDALTWALSFAAWECRTIRQKRRRRKEQPHESEAHSGEGMAQEARMAIRELFSELRPEDVEVLLAQAGMIEKPSISSSAFRKRLQRARLRALALWRRSL